SRLEFWEMLRRLKTAGITILVSTPYMLLDNMDPETVREAVRRVAGRAVVEASGGITLERVREYAETGVDIIDIYLCPHQWDAGCSCRKPKPGMFQRIASSFNTDLSKVYAVGDSLRDLKAASTAGANPMLVLTGKGPKTQAAGGLPEGTLVFADLSAAVDYLLSS
ncbi:MAG: HAD-IIIA family hydrolase, partial [Betaproteobacteria bacterium]